MPQAPGPFLVHSPFAPAWRNWQTQGTQNPPRAISSRFESESGHQHEAPADGLSSRVMATAPLAPIPGAPTAGTTIRTLAGLAAYACGHSGSCCRAGWPIPVEAEPLQILRRVDTAIGLPRRLAAAWLQDGVLGHSPEHGCVFHARGEASGGCALETAIGTAALPYSCRQFPRLLLADARGWHLTLSAWCVTASRLIASFDGDSPIGVGPDDALQQPSGDGDDFLSFDHITADPRVHLEALDARDAWPPLLRPGVLAGFEAYTDWEARVLGEWLSGVTHGAATLADGLADAIRWTELLRRWQPAHGDLGVLISRRWPRRGLAGVPHASAGRDQRLRKMADDLMSRVPPQWRAPDWPAGLTDADADGPPVSRAHSERALARYLGVRLTASWVAYQGQGLRSVLASLVSSMGLATLALRMNGSGAVTIGRLTAAIRAADWLQLHLLDRDAWAGWCSEWESVPDAMGLVTLVADAGRELDGLCWTAPSSDGRLRA